MLFFFKILRLVSQLSHLFGELSGAAILKLIAKLFQFTLGPRTVGRRLRGFALFQRL